ncbi:hypothetical protein [Sinorhizobium fredii]|uniref:hypothetical protein n=1 Tax=Rhizobium fredii TaxID=380 RepID=UPI0005956D50|nr:hypothetical protein [Sinorhizobium fredii]WOS62178.1 hypothetical protein SFGR64A_14745 [Sinorhizobium fredii GR64]
MLARTAPTLVAGMPQNIQSSFVGVVDHLDNAKAFTQALVMAAEGTTGCDEVEIDAIARLAVLVADEIRRAKALIEQAREIPR